MPVILERPPATQAVPLHTPISFLGGMGHDRELNQFVAGYFQQSLGRVTLTALAEPDTKSTPSGYRVISETGTRIMPRPFAYLETAKPDTLAITALQQEARAAELIESIKSQAAEPVTHIGQSADAQNAVIAARERPDLFKNLILLFPSGMVKKQRRTEYSRQIASSMRGEKTPKDIVLPENDFLASTRPSSLRERVKSKRYKKSGGYALAATAIAADSRHLLHEMRQQEGAPGVALVLGLKDKMMRPDRIIESLISADDVDYILITNTGHGMNGRRDLAAELLRVEAMNDRRNEQRKAVRARGETFDPGSLSDRLVFMSDVPREQQEKLKIIAANVPQISEIAHSSKT